MSSPGDALAQIQGKDKRIRALEAELKRIGWEYVRYKETSAKLGGQLAERNSQLHAMEAERDALKAERDTAIAEIQRLAKMTSTGRREAELIESNREWAAAYVKERTRAEEAEAHVAEPCRVVAECAECGHTPPCIHLPLVLYVYPAKKEAPR